MANKPISSPLPANLPTTWIDSQIIAASGASVGLSEQHGYNYLMEQVNTAQSSINTINDAFADLATTEDINDLTAADVGADPTGTAAQAVSTHNTSPDAHTSLFAAKQNKLTGAQGQVVGFDSQGNAQAQDPPGGGSGKRTCRFTVGTSTAGWTADDCDYLCDGTADDVEINAAIQALPSTGGEIVILDGTYNITATIAMNKDNVTLSGNEAGTIISFAFNSNAIYCSGYSSIQVESLTIIGDSQSYDNSSGISVFNANATENKCTIKNVTVKKTTRGISLGNVSYSIISNCKFIDNYYGVNINGVNFTVISENQIYNSRNTGINGNNSKSIIISNNIIDTTVYNGIDIGNTTFSCISNNIVRDFGTTGIKAYNYLTLIGNQVFRGSGTPSDYSSSQYTIYAKSGSQENLIVGNQIMGKNYVDEGTNNTFANNKYQ